MTRKTRLLILIFCIVCFFAAAPVLIAYSMGYRFDFEKMEIVGTGGIYVRTFPAAEQIIINSKISMKPGVFSNAIFVQSLLPKDHTVYIEKNGYHNYFKTLPVQEKTVTKLENIILFKKIPIFNILSEKIDYFSVAPDNQNIITVNGEAKNITLSYFNLNKNSESKKISIAASGKISEIKWSSNSSFVLVKMQASNNIHYYLLNIANQAPKINRLNYLDKNSKQISFNPQNGQEIFYEENNTLYSLKDGKPKIVIKNLISYVFSENNILWLSSEGTLNESNASGELLGALTKKNIILNSSKKYNLFNVSGRIFLQENNSLFLYNQNTKIFENFNMQEGNYIILHSPDSKNLIFWNENKIYLYSYENGGGPPAGEVELFSGKKIKNLQWLNNNYIIFYADDKIVISEIDYRGNINAITMPSILDLGKEKIIDISNSQTFYNQQSGKLYILSNDILAVSEKLTPS